MSASRRLVVAGLAVATSVSGCSGLQFQQDRRLAFTSPRANALTTTPVTLSWTMKGYPTRSGGDQYAVFVDAAPIKVGRTLRSLVPSGTADGAVPALLQAKRVYVTPATSLVLTSIPDIAYDTDKRQRHTVTVILVDASGKRTTESAWSRSFDLHALDNGSTS